MDINEFVENFASQFDETDVSEINASTLFHNLEEWSSIIAMSILAMAKVEYGKAITGAELKDCMTVEDVFDLINDK